LDISNTELKNYNVIGKMKNLDSLSFSNCNLQNLSILKDLKNLCNLSISNSKIASFQGIENLTNLEYLDCDGTNLSDLNCIKDLINLTFLNISNNPITSLECLGDMLKLRTLFVSKTKITNFKGLEKIDIEFEKIAYWDNEIEDFSHLRNYNPSKLIEDDTDYYDYEPNEDYSYRNTYCGSCESSPCMCSDREKTSMTY
jgi:hypothetical protein